MKVEKLKIVGFEEAIRGMRNPYDSWDKSDSVFYYPNTTNESNLNNTNKVLNNSDCWINTTESKYVFDATSINTNESKYMFDTVSIRSDNTACIGFEDLKLARKLIKGGQVHSKFERMIVLYMDLTASFDFWKEYDTYKVATVADSCSTMHTITKYPISIDNFSKSDLRDKDIKYIEETVIPYLNEIRNDETLDKVEKTRILSKLNLLGFEQKRTVMLNYATLHGMYTWRKNHTLLEWRDLMNNYIAKLPYFKKFYLESDEEFEKEFTGKNSI